MRTMMKTALPVLFARGGGSGTTQPTDLGMTTTTGTRVSPLAANFRQLSVALSVLGVVWTAGCNGDKPTTGPELTTPSTTTTSATTTGEEPFSFIVFGDLNGGDCAKNIRLNHLVALMADRDADLYLQTGDLIDGYGDTSCFAVEPPGCNSGEESGNIREQLAPLLDRAPKPGLQASFYPIIGNHDDNWGSGWYPDPCGQGICDFLGLDTTSVMSTYLTHGPEVDGEGLFPHSLHHGDVCSLDPDESGHPDDFFYSFDYRNSTFIVLRLNDDWYGMLSCNGSHPGYDSCEEYCADTALLLDDDRNANCYSIEQYDWLVGELRRAQLVSEHIFVFAHAPLLGNGDNHGPTAGAAQYRTLLEAHDVEVFFNGHNHAYERTHAVRGDALDPTGTVYITTGVGGALTDGNMRDWFTAATYSDWTSYGNQASMTTYLEVTVDGAAISGEVVSLVDGVVDTFER